MTTSRLSARVDRLAARLGPPEAVYRVDLNLLAGGEADRLVVLGYTYLAGDASPDETDELRALLARSLSLTSYGGFLPPFVVPRELERFWRQQKYVDHEFNLPGGNYRFNSLCFADRERLMKLSQKYCWEQQTDAASIVPLTVWAVDDMSELFDLLWRATSKNEREMWLR